jgi:phosphatidylglycerol---prolipoprotein diacylglyceryl transferase
MFPFLIRQGDLVIPTFPVMLMLASLAAVLYPYFRAPSKQLSQTVILDLGILGTVAGLVGARLFHILFEAPAKYWHEPSLIFQFWRGGFVSFGAITLIGISFYLYLKIRKLDTYKYLDLMALGFPLVVFFVRLGCLGAGCCYGKPTSFFLHLVFHNPLSDAGSKFPGIPLHATQVYGMLNGIFLFIVLHWIDRRKKFDGQIICSFLILYGFTRSLQEFLRGDVERGVYFDGTVSTGQILGIFSIVFGVLLYRFLRERLPQRA